MIGTECQLARNVYHREPRQNTALSGFFDTFFNGWNEFLWNHTPFNGVNKLKMVIAANVFRNLFTFNKGLHRSQSKPYMAVLTLASCLLDVLVLRFSFSQNSLLIGHLWLTDIGFHSKLTLHAIHHDFKVKLAHTRDNGLTCLGIS